MKNKILKICFILISIFMVVPSIIYLIQNKTVRNFNIYFNFFLNSEANKVIATITFLILLVLLFILYILIMKRKALKSMKQILLFVVIISIIFMFMLPWTSSDIFYYMGVGELDGVYGQNPYYVTMQDYYEENKESINDDILEAGAENGWSNTTVVYGPVAQTIFKVCSMLSFKSVDIAMIVYKLVNLIFHIGTCFLIYKITKKEIFLVIYGLNPLILIEFLGNVHNDIIMVFVILLSLYFLLKKKNLLCSIICLSIATGIKYVAILLLPVVIIYYFKKEKKLNRRFLKCAIYGMLFLLIIGIIYAIYGRDMQIFINMLSQTQKYSRSIYSVIQQNLPEYTTIVSGTLMGLFILYYLKFCIDLITEKNIKFYKIIRKYNFVLILFSLLLGTFQVWYIVWLFATIMWQKPNMIRNILGITLIAEIATSVYMFTAESYTFDLYFIELIARTAHYLADCSKQKNLTIHKLKIHSCK